MSASGRPLAAVLVGALLLAGCCSDQGDVDPVDEARWHAMEAAVAHYPHHVGHVEFGTRYMPNRVEIGLEDPALATLSEDDSRQFVAGIVDWLHGDGWQPTWVSCTESDAPTNGAMDSLWVATAFRLVDGVSYAMRIEGQAGPLWIAGDQVHPRGARQRRTGRQPGPAGAADAQPR